MNIIIKCGNTFLKLLNGGSIDWVLKEDDASQFKLEDLSRFVKEYDLFDYPIRILKVE